MDSSEFGTSRPNRPVRDEEEDQELPAFEDQTRNLLDHDELPDEEDDEGEDLMANAEDDYRHIPELDTYEQRGIDDEELDDDEEGARLRAERALERREEAARTGQVTSKDLLYDDDDEMAVDRDAVEHAIDFDQDGVQATQAIEHLEDTRGMSVREWVSQEQVKREIANRFKHFLRNYIDSSGQAVFRSAIDKMVEDNKQSLVIGYDTLCEMKPVLAYFLPEAPKEILLVFDSAATEVVFSMFPRYNKIQTKIFIRISGLPILEEIRNLRCIHLSQLITVEGVVASATSVTPQMAEVRYRCMRCNTVTQPYIQKQTEEVRPTICLECQGKGPFQVDMEKTLYQNYQRIRVQESPGSVKAGRLPRAKEAILTADLVDTCKPGDEIRLTGVYEASYEGSLNVKNGFPVFTTVIMANFIERKEDRMVANNLTDEDVDKIKKLARDERIGK